MHGRCYALPIFLKAAHMLDATHCPLAMCRKVVMRGACEVMWCDAKWLSDVAKWEMMHCELQRAHVTAKLLRCPFQCAVQLWDAKHNETTESPCHSTTTPHSKVITIYYVLQSTTPYYEVKTIANFQVMSLLFGEQRPHPWPPSRQ